jgi:SAM-dependent methyltransferase
VRSRDRALADEVAFWERWMTRNQAELRSRLNSELAHDVVAECLIRIEEPEVAIIDVGSGPLTTLGTRFDGKRIRLTAVDPLAREYESVLERAKIEPPVPAIPCSGEELPERFDPESFDIAFSENALDHVVDPIRIVRNMVGLIRPGRYVVLDHQRNEAEHAAYGQLHQWNFDERDGRCVLWRGEREHDLERELSGIVSVECRRVRRPGKPRDRIVCVLQKRTDA